MPGHSIDALQFKRSAEKASGKPETVVSPALTLTAGTSEIDHAWELAKKLKTCMLTTRSAGGMRSRPMHALPDQSAGCLWFITDRRGAKEEEIRAAPEVCLAFAETGSNTYLSMTGCADMTHDVAKIAQLWSAEAQAWWPKGPNDADVRLLRVIPDSAEYWDARGNSIVVAFKLTMARLNGTPPQLDGSHKVRLRKPRNLQRDDRERTGSVSAAANRRAIEYGQCPK
jgi:general stress protein 26